MQIEFGNREAPAKQVSHRKQSGSQSRKQTGKPTESVEQIAKFQNLNQIQCWLPRKRCTVRSIRRHLINTHPAAKAMAEKQTRNFASFTIESQLVNQKLFVNIVRSPASPTVKRFLIALASYSNGDLHTQITMRFAGDTWLRSRRIWMSFYKKPSSALVVFTYLLDIVYYTLSTRLCAYQTAATKLFLPTGIYQRLSTYGYLPSQTSAKRSG